MKKSLIETVNGSIQTGQSDPNLRVPLKLLIQKLREHRFARDFESQLVVLFRKQDFPFHRIVLPNREWISRELLERYVNALDLPESLLQLPAAAPSGESKETENRD